MQTLKPSSPSQQARFGLRWHTLIACLLLVSIWAAAGLAQAAISLPEPGSRIALVIGNARYAQSPLRNPVNDAQAFSALLQRAGFSVDQHMDATQQDLRQAAIRFGTAMRDPKVKFALFYYAGHGVQLGARNYLIPVNVTVRTANDVQTQAVDVSDLLQHMKQAQGKNYLIILDACRDDPFGGSYRPADKGLSQFDAPAGSLLAYSTGPGKVALDGDGANGLYTSHLLREFEVPGVRVEDAFKLVRTSVRRASKGAQVPWESTSLEDDVVLFPTSHQQLTEAEREALLDEEIKGWMRVKTASSIDPLVEFIRQFPSGSTSELAQAKLNRMLISQEEAARQQAQAQQQQQAQQQAQQQRVAEEKRLQEEKLLAQARVQAEEQRLAEEKRQAAEQRRVEEQRLAQAKQREAEQRMAEEKRIAEGLLAVARVEAERVAQAQRRAEETRLAAEQRRAEVQRLAEEQRIAEGLLAVARIEAERVTEAQRLAQEKRLAAEQRRAEEQRLAQAQRLVEEQRLAQAKQREAEQRLAQAQRAQEAFRLQAQTQAQKAEQEALTRAEESRQAAAVRQQLAAALATTQQAALAKSAAAAVTPAPEPLAVSFVSTPYFQGYDENLRHYRVGDEFVFRMVDGFSGREIPLEASGVSTPLRIRVTAVDVANDRVEFNSGDYITDLMGNTLKHLTGIFDEPRQFYPAELYIGKHWKSEFRQARNDGLRYTFRYTLRVVAREKITVPAGTFNAYRIEAEGFNMQLAASLSRKIWVVPGISADIASETLVRLRNGRINQFDRQELVKYPVRAMQQASGL